MKLWLLEGIKDRDIWDIHVGFVIRASNEAEARRIAQDEADEEWNKEEDYWMDAQKATCEELIAEGETGVIIADYKAG